MRKKEVKEKVIQLFAEAANVNPDTVTTDAVLSLYMDSLQRIEFIVLLEDEFQIELPADVDAKWSTVEDVINDLTFRLMELHLL